MDMAMRVAGMESMRPSINMLGLGSNSSPYPSPWASPRLQTPSQPTSPPGHHPQTKLPTASLTKGEVAAEWGRPRGPPGPWSARHRWRLRERWRMVERGDGHESWWRRRWGEQALHWRGACSKEEGGGGGWRWWQGFSETRHRILILADSMAPTASGEVVVTGSSRWTPSCINLRRHRAPCIAGEEAQEKEREKQTKKKCRRK